MSFDRQFEIFAPHARTVVGDPDQRRAAVDGYDFDAGGAGIDGIFDQFLDDACRTLDYLSRGNAVDGLGAQLAYMGGCVHMLSGGRG